MCADADLPKREYIEGLLEEAEEELRRTLTVRKTRFTGHDARRCPARIARNGVDLAMGRFA